MRDWLVGLGALALAGSGMGMAQQLPEASAAVRARILPANPPAELSPVVQRYVRAAGPVVVLEHVRVIDGTGAAAEEDRNVTIEGGKIQSVEAGADVPAAEGRTVLDLHGYTVMPGIVGMHNHLYYIARPDLTADGKAEPPLLVPQMTFSAPRLYLAAGVTTMRTTGSVETYTDLNLKRQIDEGKLPGPHMDVTGPYLEGQGSPFIQMHQITGPEDAKALVDYWADQGVTSFKAYMFIKGPELKAAIDEAHRRGIKVTGHLCAVTYPEAAALGIDDLEHGFFVNTQEDRGKEPDKCTPADGTDTAAHMDPNGAEAAALIKLLVAKHVAVTSTLPVFAASMPAHEPLRQGMLDALTPEARDAYLYARNGAFERAGSVRAQEFATAFRNDMAMERNFVKAGGLLLAGPDPTGNGGVVPGFGDQREIELLVQAGFAPVEAIRVATRNGAEYLGLADRIGTVAAGKDADLVVIKGDPSRRIEDVEKVEMVFKDGVGFDSGKLLESVRGRYGEY
jgi:imidazolonepropionase-like amidohydrolase